MEKYTFLKTKPYLWYQRQIWSAQILIVSFNCTALIKILLLIEYYEQQFHPAADRSERASGATWIVLWKRCVFVIDVVCSQIEKIILQVGDFVVHALPVLLEIAKKGNRYICILWYHSNHSCLHEQCGGLGGRFDVKDLDTLRPSFRSAVLEARTVWEQKVCIYISTYVVLVFNSLKNNIICDYRKNPLTLLSLYLRVNKQEKNCAWIKLFGPKMIPRRFVNYVQVHSLLPNFSCVIYDFNLTFYL